MTSNKWPQTFTSKETKMNDSKCFFLSLLWLSASTQFILLRGHLSLRHFYYNTLRLLLLLLVLLLPLVLLLDQSNRDVCRFLLKKSKSEKTNRNRNIIEEKINFLDFHFSKHLIHSFPLIMMAINPKKLLIDPATHPFSEAVATSDFDLQLFDDFMWLLCT